MSNSGSASVTIEWDPPSEGRGPFNYTIMAITDLLSGPLPVTPPPITPPSLSATTLTMLSLSLLPTVQGMDSHQMSFNSVQIG